MAAAVCLSANYHQTTTPPQTLAKLCKLVSPNAMHLAIDAKMALDLDYEEQSAYAHVSEENQRYVETSIGNMRGIVSDPSAQALIGAVTTDASDSQLRSVDPHFVNPMAPSGLVYDSNTRQVVRSSTYQCVPAPNNNVLLRQLASNPRGVQYSRPTEGPLLPDELNPFRWLELDMQSKLTLTARPQFILSGDFFKWVRLPKAFPVWVNYPQFGSALALRHLAWTADGLGLQHRFAIKKLLPLGYVEGAPFNGGVYSIPAQWCVRLPLATMDLIPAQDFVTLVSDCGERWSESFVEFSNNPDWRFEMARNALVMDQPNLLADLFATRLLTAPPARYKRSTFSLPPNLDTPAVVNLRDASLARQPVPGATNTEDQPEEEAASA